MFLFNSKHICLYHMLISFFHFYELKNQTSYGMKNPEISKVVDYDIYSRGNMTLCSPCHLTLQTNQETHFIE